MNLRTYFMLKQAMQGQAPMPPGGAGGAGPMPPQQQPMPPQQQQPMPQQQQPMPPGGGARPNPWAGMSAQAMQGGNPAMQGMQQQPQMSPQQLNAMMAQFKQNRGQQGGAMMGAGQTPMPPQQA